MLYLRISDQSFGITEQQIRTENPNTSYPRPIPVEVPGYVGVQDVERPSFDAITHSAREIPPVQVDGVWTQQWEVFALPDDIVATHIAAAYAASIPSAVTMRQARLALLGAGKLTAVDAAIAALPEPQRSAALIEWEYSGEVQRHNGFVAALGPALGLSAAQIDALFIAAASL